MSCAFSSIWAFPFNDPCWVSVYCDNRLLFFVCTSLFFFSYLFLRSFMQWHFVGFPLWEILWFMFVLLISSVRMGRILKQALIFGRLYSQYSSPYLDWFYLPIWLGTCRYISLISGTNDLVLPFFFQFPVYFLLKVPYNSVSNR